MHVWNTNLFSSDVQIHTVQYSKKLGKSKRSETDVGIGKSES
jgi:hypothetical protein